MDNFLTKDKVKIIVNNAPKGTKPEDVINGLVSRGYKLEGFNDQPEPVVEKTMTGSDKSPFQSTGNENVISGTAKAIGNLPSSTIELGKNVVSAVTHPIDTVKSIADMIGGAGAKLGEKFLENTDIGQEILKKANESRTSRGLEPLKTDANGKLQASDTKEIEMINKVGGFISDRYGSMDKFKETAIEDPAGVLADIATIFTGGGGLISKVGDISKVSDISKAGQFITKTGQAIEPINAVTKTAKNITTAVKNSTPGRVISDIVPTASDIRSGEVIKAIDLTQGDVSSITKLTGNEPSAYIVSKGIVKGTPEEIASELNNLRQNTMTEVRSEIGKVKTTYTTTDVPFVKKGLDVILQGVDEVPGLESVADEIRTLANKETFSLEDVQKAKEIIDENSNIYSKIGDVKSSSTAKGLGNLRKEAQTFIENEVDTATGGKTNIRELNNDVQTSYAIEQAINNRATRNLTRQGLSVFDGILGAGGISVFGPAIGISIVVAKKVAETPAFRLAVAKTLSLQPATRLKSILNEFKTNSLKPSTIKMLDEAYQTIKNNKQIIESGSSVLQNAKETKPESKK